MILEPGMTCSELQLRGCKPHPTGMGNEFDIGRYPGPLASLLLLLVPHPTMEGAAGNQVAGGPI